MSNNTNDAANINVSVAQAHGALNHGWTVLGTLFIFFGLGMGAWAIASFGLLELAATGMSFFFVQLISMMFKAGLIVLPEKNSSEFSQTSGFVKTAWREFQEFQGRSPIWRMALLAIGFTLAYLIFRWGLSVAFGIFANPWLAGSAVAILASLVVAPNLFASFAGKLKSKSGIQVKTTTEGEDK